jgi:DNA-binding response OmpR family regulator
MTLNSIKIALIEDEYNLQNMYRFKLELEGFSVKIAGNGLEGLHLIEEFKPHLVLLDLRMPIMSGEEMLARLREHEWAGDIRVIILTNISKNEAPQSLRFLNVDRYIVKAHSTPGQVVEVICEVLNLDLAKRPA